MATVEVTTRYLVRVDEETWTLEPDERGLLLTYEDATEIKHVRFPVHVAQSLFERAFADISEAIYAKRKNSL